MKQRDMLGMKFGKLTLIKLDHISKTKNYYYLCRCDCGKEKVIELGGIRRGVVTSCGCGRKDKADKNMIGKKFERLTVERRSGESVDEGGFIWVCKCDCGNYVKASTTDLNRKRVKSCGCYRIDRAKTPRGTNKYNYKGIDSVITRTLAAYKKSAKTKNRDFDLTREELEEIVRKPCIYCGEIDSKKSRWVDEWFDINGIDRIDNTKGYVKGNIVPCCWKCNSMKSNFSLKDFTEWISKVYKHFIQPKREQND